MNFPDNYVIFDLETTGLEATKDDIIEIGALKYKNNQLVEEFSVLINPGYDIPEVITKITGITTTQVLDKEKISTVLPKFIAFIEDYPLIAHNSPFDMGFVNENMKQLGLSCITNKVIDTLVLARKYIPQVYNYKLETLKHYFKINQVSHRAVGDCHTTNYIYQECKKRASILNR